VLIVIAVILGWLSGVLVNYLADVLPLRRRFARPFCIACDADQPYLSYLVFPRKCSKCGSRRSIRTWIVELCFVFSTALIWQYPPDGLGFWLGQVVLIYFGVIVIIDLEYRLILHPMSLFGAVLGLLVGIYLNGLLSTILGGLVGFGSMWLLYLFGAVLMRWIARRRGEELTDVALGFGDVNLSGVLGLFLGWPAILVGLFISVLIGGVFSLLYLIVMVAMRRYRLYSALPYGPFLVAGAVLILFFRDYLIQFFSGL